MDGEQMGNEPSRPDEPEDDPVASQALEEHAACSDRGGIEPEEHARALRGPEIVSDPFDKAAIEK